MTNQILPNLEMPRTTRFAEESEVPRQYWERIAARREAHFSEGFTLKEVKDTSQQFNFYAEVNVHNSKLWGLFIELTEMLPDVCACLFSFFNDEVNYGEYQSKELVLAIIGSLKKELIEDCRMEFGLIYNDEESLVEVYVAESKFIKVWGVDKQLFKQIMQRNGIPEFDEMRFVDEYPKVVVPLTTLDADAKSTEEIIDLLEKAFVINPE